MGFDDLARHMASRDGQKTPQAQGGNIDQFMAEAAELDRKLNRKRDLILGPVLLVGGAVMLVLFVLYFMDAFDTTPHPERPENRSQTILIPTGGMVVAAGAVITGLRKTIRGLRGR